MFTFACSLQTKRKRDTRHRVDDVSGFSERFGSENPFLPLRAQRVRAVHVLQKEKVTVQFGAAGRRLDATNLVIRPHSSRPIWSIGRRIERENFLAITRRITV